MLSEEEKNSIELDIEAKYVGRTEKNFLNNITYAECLYILDTKNNYCDDIKTLSLLNIVNLIEKQQAEIEKQNRIIDNAINEVEKVRQYYDDGLQPKFIGILEILKDKKVID